jgi:protein-S-isoprenylcysteine O-methyltransferase Ste14
MNATGTRIHTPKPSLDRWGIKRIVELAGTTILIAVILFVSAGRLDWWRAWIVLSLWSAALIGMSVVILRQNPALINERGKRHANTKPFDKIFFALYLPLSLIVLVVAGLDAGRFGWSSMSLMVSIVGGFLYIPTFIIVAWAMAENSHFETTVRIQTDRNHQVCSSGPYRYVRHPGYVGMILMNSASPLVLGSWWACVPAGMIVLLVIIRTALEDRTLRAELPGYVEFTQCTRYRLLPGVW